ARPTQGLSGNVGWRWIRANGSSLVQAFCAFADSNVLRPVAPAFGDGGGGGHLSRRAAVGCRRRRPDRTDATARPGRDAPMRPLTPLFRDQVLVILEVPLRGRDECFVQPALKHRASAAVRYDRTEIDQRCDLAHLRV